MAALSHDDIKAMYNKINDMLSYISMGINHRVEYACTEMYFEIAMENIHEDNIVEVEIWINIGSQTAGRIYGYDEGIRFNMDYDNVEKIQIELKEMFNF